MNEGQQRAVEPDGQPVPSESVERHETDGDGGGRGKRPSRPARGRARRKGQAAERVEEQPALSREELLEAGGELASSADVLGDVAAGVVHACAHDGLTLADLADKAGLTEAVLRRFGLSDERRHGRAVVRLPYRSRDGIEELAVRYASRVDALRDGAPDWKSGSSPALFGLQALPSPVPKGIAVCVGELDVLTLAQHDVPAVGLPDAETWAESWAAPFEDVDEVYVVTVARPDGELAVPAWLNDSSLRRRARLVGLERGSVHDAYLRDRGGFPAAWRAALAGAPAWEERRAEQLYERCGRLAEEEDILMRFDEQLRRATTRATHGPRGCSTWSSSRGCSSTRRPRL